MAIWRDFPLTIGALSLFFVSSNDPEKMMFQMFRTVIFQKIKHGFPKCNRQKPTPNKNRGGVSIDTLLTHFLDQPLNPWFLWEILGQVLWEQRWKGGELTV